MEIVTAACVLHNFCYLCDDEWTGEIHIENNIAEYGAGNQNREERRLGQEKRDRIARTLYYNGV